METLGIDGCLVSEGGEIDLYVRSKEVVVGLSRDARVLLGISRPHMLKKYSLMATSSVGVNNFANLASLALTKLTSASKAKDFLLRERSCVNMSPWISDLVSLGEQRSRGSGSSSVFSRMTSLVSRVAEWNCSSSCVGSKVVPRWLSASVLPCQMCARDNPILCLRHRLAWRQW